MNTFLVVFGLTEMAGLAWRIYCDRKMLQRSQDLKLLEDTYKQNEIVTKRNLEASFLRIEELVTELNNRRFEIKLND